MAKTNVISLESRPRGSRCCYSRRALLHDDEAERQSNDLGLLANPIRLQLLHLLLAGPAPICVCDLMSALGLKQPTVSHHLKLLKDAGLVESEKRGVWSHWSVKADGLAELKRRLSASMAALK